MKEMSRIRNKFFVIIFSLSLLGLVFGSNASAYVFESDGNRFFKCSTCTTSYPTYSWGDYLSATSTSGIKTGWLNALGDWRSAQSKVNFTYSSSANSKLHSMHNADKSLFGRMVWKSDLLNYVTHFDGYINAYADNNGQSISNSNVARSAGSHELGHVMGIAHNSGTSIMNSNRNRTTVFRPQADDINGINARYK